MKDNFSTDSNLYKQFRPEYPQSLFEFIANTVSTHENVWDCGTGNGQIAKELSKNFVNVYATDISRQQLENAEEVNNIIYSQQPAEKTNFPNTFFDVITVGQAVHWFDFEAFYNEVCRTLKKNGTLAIIGYGKLQIDSEIDALVDYLYFDVLGEYWDSERKYVDENYLTIPFPFNEIATPVFTNQQFWSLEQLLGYLHTWSAVKHYQNKNKTNPIDSIKKELCHLWKEDRKKEITFPILTRFGKL